MELRQLRYFLQVLESGGFSPASSVLHVAQPALSRQVKALEEELGVALLHRTGRGVRATVAGRALAEGARRLLDDAADLRKRVLGFRETLVGEATVGLPPTIGRVLGLPLIEHVRQHHPQINLCIAETFSGTMLEWLHSGRVDAAVLYSDPQVSSIHVDHVADEPLSVIGVPDSLPSGCALIPASALAGRPLVVPTRHHGLRRVLERYAAEANLRLTVAAEIDSLHAIIAAVRGGMGWSVLPAVTVRDEIAAGTVASRLLADPPLFRPLLVATTVQRSDAVTARELGRLLKAQMESIAPEAGWLLRRDIDAPAMP